MKCAVVVECVGGWIRRLREASMELCEQLETEAPATPERPVGDVAARAEASHVPDRKAARKVERRARRALTADAITQYRDECGWTLDDLAGRMDRDRSVVAKHCSGKTAPRPRTLQQYADLFTKTLKCDVTIGDLLRGKAMVR
jgi:ribosome-binding protein aMBF1 (putative translation factor)